MKLTVPFKCHVDIVRLHENYSGSVQFGPAMDQQITLYFLFIKPFKGRGAEIGIYVDESRSIPLREATGEDGQELFSTTNELCTTFDFGSLSPKISGILMIALSIITHSVIKATKKLVAIEATKASIDFCDTFEQEFNGDVETCARGFLKAFGPPRVMNN